MEMIKEKHHKFHADYLSLPCVRQGFDKGRGRLLSKFNVYSELDILGIKYILISEMEFFFLPLLTYIYVSNITHFLCMYVFMHG